MCCTGLCHTGSVDHSLICLPIADRFSVNPPSTYLDKPFLIILNAQDSRLEYKQVNLGNKDRHAELFTPPDKTGKGVFDVVFDLTGETSAEKPEVVSLYTYTHLVIHVTRLIRET